MRDLEKYKGIIPAFYACYDSNGDISVEGIKKLTHYFIENKVKGVYVGGSSGECIYQSVEDRKLTLETVVKEAAGRLTIIAHIACNNTKDSIELAKHADALGVDAIASIPPIYFKLPEYAIAKYWNDMSDAAPNCDFIIYNIPQLAGVSLTKNLLKTMLQNPRVIGVKNSSMPVIDIEQFKQTGGEDIIVFNGPDEQFIAGRIMGAEGGIGGTYGAMPDLFVKLDELFVAGKFEEARKLQYAINNIIYKMVSGHGSMYAVIKEILRINADIDIGGVRHPLADIIPEDLPMIREAAEDINKARARFL